MKAGLGHSIMDVCRIDAPACACKRSKECEQIPSRAARSLAERRDRSAVAHVASRWNFKRVVVSMFLAAAMIWLEPIIYDEAASLLWFRAAPLAKPGSSYCLRWGIQHAYCYSSLGGIHKQHTYYLQQHHGAQQSFATPAAAPPAAAAPQFSPRPGTPAAIVLYLLAHYGIHEAHSEIWHRAWAQSIMSARAHNVSRLSPAAVLQQAAASVPERALLFSFGAATCDPGYIVQDVIFGKNAADGFRDGQWESGVKAFADTAR